MLQGTGVHHDVPHKLAEATDNALAARLSLCVALSRCTGFTTNILPRGTVLRFNTGAQRFFFFHCHCTTPFSPCQLFIYYNTRLNGKKKNRILRNLGETIVFSDIFKEYEAEESRSIRFYRVKYLTRGEA